MYEDGKPTPPAMTTSQIADAYQVHVKTMRKWINSHKDTIGKKIGNLWTA